MSVLRQAQQDQGDQFLGIRNQTLKNVIKKNDILIGGVPSAVTTENVKKEFLNQRKHLMIRMIHSELRNKKVTEWTMKSLNRA